MQDMEVSIITRSEELPAMASRNFFHSKEFFLILEKTPGCSPYMCLCTDEHGIVQAHILAVVYRRGSWVPPYIYSHARIYGEGEYRDVETKDELFGRMLIMLTKFFRRRLCLYIEFSNLSTKMFGYKHLRRMGYTPVRWLQVHNSLHSKPPKERLSDKMLRKVEACEKQGTIVREVQDEQELNAFYKILRRYYRFKVQRFIPKIEMFRLLLASERCRIFVTTLNGKVIGGSAVVYSNHDAYLWYVASRRKTYMKYHPYTTTVWHVLNDAHQRGCHHLWFMNAGLPFSKNPEREFILRFGGKPTSTYRWFRSMLPWANRILGMFWGG